MELLFATAPSEEDVGPSSPDHHEQPVEHMCRTSHVELEVIFSLNYGKRYRERLPILDVSVILLFSLNHRFRRTSVTLPVTSAASYSTIKINNASDYRANGLTWTTNHNLNSTCN